MTSDLLLKFRQSKDYTREMLIRDLIEYAGATEKRLASAEARLTATERSGTWQPTISFGGASVGVTYSAQLGRYTRSGKNVIAMMQFKLSSKGTSVGVCALGGFPFAPAPNQFILMNIGYYTGLVIPANTPFAFLGDVPGLVYGRLLNGTTNAGTFTDANITAATLLLGTASYITDDP